jgi:hypothetical protein
MKKHLLVLASVIVGLTAFTARAQPRGMMPQGPSWDGALAKLFGDNAGFTATAETHLTQASGEEMVITSKFAHLEGKARFEMDMSDMHSSHMSAQAVAHMKQMGMTKVIMITRRDLDLNYMIYPDMKAYTSMPLRETNSPASDFKIEKSKLGEESFDGHDCVKNKVVVTSPDGVIHESTVWNATDLKQFPIKIQSTTKEGREMVMLFKDVKLEKPDADPFEAPTDCTKYDDMTSLMMSRARATRPQ